MGTIREWIRRWRLYRLGKQYTRETGKEWIISGKPFTKEEMERNKVVCAEIVKSRTLNLKDEWVNRGCPITIAFQKARDYWIARILEFDIIGTGDSKDNARDQAKELFLDYLVAVDDAISEDGWISFYNPSDEGEWNNARDIEACFLG